MLCGTSNIAQNQYLLLMKKLFFEIDISVSYNNLLSSRIIFMLAKANFTLRLEYVHYQSLKISSIKIILCK